MPHPTTKNTQRFITAREAAALIGIQKSTFYDWLARGYLPCHRMGRIIRISKDDLDAYLERTRMNEFIMHQISGLDETPHQTQDDC